VRPEHPNMNQWNYKIKCMMNFVLARLATR
jgi:hypothetical protein